MTAPDEPLFAPADVGLDIDTWDDLPAAPTGPRCRECRRRLRSRESREAGIGPGCAAKIGRAVTARRTQTRAARP